MNKCYFGDTEATNIDEILFKKRKEKTVPKIKEFLIAIDDPKLSEDQVKFCEKYLM